jgi:hypothetical protein
VPEVLAAEVVDADVVEEVLVEVGVVVDVEFWITINQLAMSVF